MERQLITLIIPIFNMAPYLKRCMSCIEKQTYKNLEVIFIDDGSSDGSYKLLEKYGGEYDYIRVIHTGNRGVSSARNTGVQAAKGDYIVYADADDYFYEDYIEYLFEIAIKNDADLAICDYIKTADNNIEEKKKKNIVDTVKQYSQIDALENISYRKQLGAAIVGKMIKTSVARKCYFEENLAYYEDYLYFCKVINSCKNIYFGSASKYLYLQNPQSASHQYNIQKCVSSWSILNNKIENEIMIHPEIEKAYISKMLAISLDMLKRVHGKGVDETEIRKYVKGHCLIVVKDRKCKMIKRLLALSAWVNVDFTVVVGKKVLRLLSKLGKEL
ncbi:MAG: glycosyltransferase [bacterium]|nr:glycosyltransferase [bacterium]